MSSESTSTGQNRGRGRGRGNRGKSLRARGRRGLGRAAEFTPRLLLEEEREDLDGDEEEDQRKYEKREIVNNTDKYAEPEVDPNVEEEPEPEVDLSAFLAKQRSEDAPEQFLSDTLEDDVDRSLSSLSISAGTSSKPRKNNTRIIEWDASMEKLQKEKEAADAVRDLKSRFRSSQTRLVRPQVRRGTMEKETSYKVEDIRHELNPSSEEIAQSSKAQMEDFLDDLLS